MSVLNRIRHAVREKTYQFSDHALDEADADDLTEDDVLYVLLTGDLSETLTNDYRGIRYVVTGEVDKAIVDVVCRFQIDGTLLIIITVYVVE